MVAGETSFGNTGIVQTEAVFPYMFPRAPGEILNAALNRDPRAQIRYSALPSIAPFLWRYFLASSPAKRGSRPRWRCAGWSSARLAEHRAFAERRGSGALLREGGWIKVFRTPRGEDAALADAEETRPYGMPFDLLDRERLLALEPHLSEVAMGGVHFTRSDDDAGSAGAGEAYADLFLARGGRLLKGDARSLAASGDGWDGGDRGRPARGARGRRRAGPVVGHAAAALGYACRSASSAATTCIMRRAAMPGSPGRCSISRRAMSSRRWRAACG